MGCGVIFLKFAEDRALVDNLYLKNGYRRTGSYFSKDLRG